MGTLIPFNQTQASLTLAAGVQRPFDSEGVLIGADDAVRGRPALWEHAGDTITGHLEQVCTWRADQRDQAWHPGEYSFYVLSFADPSGADFFVQFWSEPDERVVGIEVCSGASNELTARQMSRKRQDQLRDRGFETGGGAGNFLKMVCAETPAALRALAREALGILCRVFGYDGSVDLNYHLHLGTRRENKAVHTAINLDDLAKLLRGWSCRVEPRLDAETGQPFPTMLNCEYAGHYFMVWLAPGLSKAKGQYGLVCLRRYFIDKSVPFAALANHVNTNQLCMQASVDSEGDLQLDQTMVLDGGVSAENLRAQLTLWHANLECVRRLINERTVADHDAAIGDGNEIIH